MTIENSTFGFIDYFIDGARQRVACQFFRLGDEMMARLDPTGARPILTAISMPMRAEVLGAFPAVLDRYKAECGQVLGAENFWLECQTNGGSALKFFQVVHHMRLYGATVSEGLDATNSFSRRLRDSETAAAREIYDIFAADLERLGLEGMPRDPGAAPAASRVVHSHSIS